MLGHSNETGTVVGQTVAFTTVADPILISTVVSEITMSSVVSGGSISDFGDNTIVERGIVYNTTTSLTINLSST